MDESVTVPKFLPWGGGEIVVTYKKVQHCGLICLSWDMALCVVWLLHGGACSSGTGYGILTKYKTLAFLELCCGDSGGKISHTYGARG